MQKVEFEYRPTIKKIYYFVLLATLIFLCVLLRINIVKLSAETYIGTTIKLILVAVVPLSILFRLLFFIRPIIFSKYVLETPFLFIQFRKKTKKVDLRQIEKLSLTLFSPRFFGGFKIELPSGEKFRFLSFLQNNHKVVEFLRNNSPQLLPATKFDGYIFTSRCVLVSWKRMLWRLKKWPFVLLKYGGVPLGFFLYLYSKVRLSSSAEFSELERWGLIFFSFISINFLVSATVNYFEEKTLNRRIFDKSDDELERWDFSNENKIFISFQALSFMASVLVMWSWVYALLIVL